MSSADVPTMNADDPRAVPATMDRQVLKASLASRLFAEQANIQVGRFIIIERAGSGGMGVVYRAYDPELEREVAIKLLLDKPDDERQRLVREARAAAKVVHPNVVSVFEVGVDGDNLFVAMEYVAGSTMRGWGKDKSPQDIVAMHIQAGRGLVAAHAAGVIHRDYKPDNVLIGSDGRPRVADFGLARAMSSQAAIPLDEAASTLSDVPDPFAAAHATASKGVLGTPAYMAPEQFHGGRVDHAADQYSFCIALYEGLTGARPFDSVASFARDPKEPLATHANIERRLRKVLERGLSMFPEDRYPSMQALLTHLERANTKRTSLYIGGGVAVGALALAAALAGSKQPTPAAEDPCANQAAAYEERVAPERVEAALAAVKTWNLEPIEVIEDRFARQRDTWTAVSEGVCREYRSEGTATQEIHDAKRRCLDDETKRLTTLLDLTEQAEQPLNVMPAIDSTASILDCGNTDIALAGGRAEEASQTKVVRERLQRLATLSQLRYGSDLTPSFEAVEREARAQPDLALQAEASYSLGTHYSGIGRYDDAEPLLKRGYRLARKAGDVDQAIFAARYLGNYYALYRDGMMTEANLWSEVAMAELDDPRLATRTVVSTLLSGSYTHEINGRAEQALDARLRARDFLVERGVQPEDRLYLKVLGELAVSYEIMGRYENAEAIYRRLIDIRLALYPNDLNNLSMLIHNLGAMLYQTGQPERAIPLIQVSLGMTPKDEMPGAWVHSANNLAVYLAEVGELDSAEELLAEVEAILDSSEVSERQRGYMLEARATIAERRGDLGAARVATKQAIEVSERTLPDDPLNGLLHQRLAFLHGQLGDVEAARREVDVARTKFGTAYTGEHPYVASLDLTAAGIEWEAGEHERAREIAQRVADSGHMPFAKNAQVALDDWAAGR